MHQLVNKKTLIIGKNVCHVCSNTTWWNWALSNRMIHFYTLQKVISCRYTSKGPLWNRNIMRNLWTGEAKIGLRDRKKIIRFWKGQEYKLYISLSTYLFPRCQSSTGVGTCYEVQIRCFLFEFVFESSLGSVIYRGYSCFLVFLKLIIKTTKTYVYFVAFSRAATS